MRAQLLSASKRWFLLGLRHKTHATSVYKEEARKLLLLNGAALFDLRGELRIAATHRVREAELAVFERQGRSLDFETRADSVVLLLSGEPLDEPIVGRGPFVMNSEDEIRQAYADFRAGHFGAFTA